MKAKFQYSKVLLTVIPFVMLIISMTFDWLETVTPKYFFAENFYPVLFLWLLSLLRVIFVLVIFAGVLYFIKNKNRTKFNNILWLGLGLYSVLASTPWGRYIIPVFIRQAFFQPFPKDMFFLAGASLFVTGIYCMIKPVKKSSRSEMNSVSVTM